MFSPAADVSAALWIMFELSYCFLFSGLVLPLQA
jgi:hypothetical protein